MIILPGWDRLGLVMIFDNLSLMRSMIDINA